MLTKNEALMKWCGDYEMWRVCQNYKLFQDLSGKQDLFINMNGNHVWGKLLAMPCICKTYAKLYRSLSNPTLKQRAIFCRLFFRHSSRTLKASMLYGKSTATRRFITPVMRECSLESVLKPHKKQVHALKFMYITHKITTIFCRGFYAKMSHSAQWKWFLWLFFTMCQVTQWNMRALAVIFHICRFRNKSFLSHCQERLGVGCPAAPIIAHL